jgi:hypothetical protein
MALPGCGPRGAIGVCGGVASQLEAGSGLFRGVFGAAGVESPEAQPSEVSRSAGGAKPV